MTLGDIEKSRMFLEANDKWRRSLPSPWPDSLGRTLFWAMVALIIIPIGMFGALLIYLP